MRGALGKRREEEEVEEEEEEDEGSLQAEKMPSLVGFQMGWAWEEGGERWRKR